MSETIYHADDRIEAIGVAVLDCFAEGAIAVVVMPNAETGGYDIEGTMEGEE